MANLVKFLSGSKAAYNALVDTTTVDESTLYFLDNGELYKGSLAIGNNHVTGTAGNIVAVGAGGEGLVGSNYQIVNTKPETTLALSSVPTVALVTEMIGDITSGAVTGATAEGDGYISISATKSAETSPVIEIAVNANTAAVSTVTETGKLADAKDVHDYIDTVSGNLVVTAVVGTTTDGYLKTYEIKQGGNVVGKIDIPKDFVVKAASVKTCSADNEPVEGLVVGEKYLDLEINVKDESQVASTHLYVPVKDLGVEYGAGGHIEITTTGSNATINVTGVTKAGTGITSVSTDLTEGKAVYEFVESKIITSVTFTGNDYIQVDAALTEQNLALTAQPKVAAESADIESADVDTYKLASDNAVKKYVDAKTQAHNAYTTITVAGEDGEYTQNASTSASSATIEFVGTSIIAQSGDVTDKFIEVNVNSDNKVETVITVATSSATVEAATYTTDNDTLISAKAVQELMTWGEIPEPTEQPAEEL